MGEARNTRNDGLERVTLEAPINPYEFRQCPSGKLGYYDSRVGASAGDSVELRTNGTASLTKATGWVGLKGGRVYVDRSAGNVTYKANSDRDYYAGRLAEDCTSSATTCNVLLNEDPPYDRDLFRDGCVTAIVGTQALGGLALNARGNSLNMVLDTTNQAQKVDALGIESFAGLANAVVEMAFRVVNGSAGAAPDLNVGLASGTDATNADNIAQYLFMHLDGSSTNINVQSKDGTTTVASTDTTLDYTAGTAAANRVEVWFDLRDLTSVKVYVNGAQVLPSTPFDISAAALEWKLLAHLEKTAAADVYEFSLDWLRSRTAEQ